MLGRLKLFYKSPVFCLVFFIFLHIFLLTQLRFFPFPELFVFPYLTNNGLIPYQQIHDQHAPGLFFLPVNFSTLGLSDEVMARVWLFVIVILVHIEIFIIVKNLTKDIRKALLANLLFFAWHPFWGGWVLWIDSFIPLFVLPVFYFTYRYLSSSTVKIRYLLLVGLLMSICVVFKQTYLVFSIGLLGLIFYYSRRITTIVFFLAGFLPTLLLIMIYFLKINIFGSFIYWTVIYNFNTYISSSVKGPDNPGYLEMIIIFSPLLLFKFIKDKRLSILLMFFGFANLIGINDRWDSIHFQPVLPFLVIGMAILFIEKFKNVWIKNYILIYFIFAILSIVNFTNNYISKDVWYFDNVTKNTAKIIRQNTKLKEEIFLFGPVPSLYYFSNTLPAGRIFDFQLPWYTKINENNQILNLINSKPNLIVRDKTISVDGHLIIEYSKELDKYIEQNYIVFERVGNVEFLKRLPE